jgi:hypothetical protein
MGAPSSRSPRRALNSRWFAYGRPAARGDDHARVEERVGDFHRGIQQATGIAAQVEHEALERNGPLCSCLERLELLAHFHAGVGLEGRDAQVGVAGLLSTSTCARC